MKVAAKYQIAYKNVLYLAGNVFEIAEEDYPMYLNDVRVVADGAWRKPIEKKTNEPLDTFRNRENYEKDTGKKAFWNGKLTNGYLNYINGNDNNK